MLDSPTLPASRSRGIDSLRALFALWVVLAHVAGWASAVQGAAAMPTLIVSAMGGLITLFQSSGETHPAVVGFIVLSADSSTRCRVCSVSGTCSEMMSASART